MNAEGSVRSGKTTDNIFCFAHDLKKVKGQAAPCNGFNTTNGKDHYRRLRRLGLRFSESMQGENTRATNVSASAARIQNYQEKIVLFCGGAKADGYKKIPWYVNRALDSDRDQPTPRRDDPRGDARQINADIKRFYWDLNPESPHAGNLSRVYRLLR